MQDGVSVMALPVTSEQWEQWSLKKGNVCLQEGLKWSLITDKYREEI